MPVARPAVEFALDAGTEPGWTRPPADVRLARRTFTASAQRLAEQVAGPVTPFKVGQRLPSMMGWFQQDGRLIAVAGPQETRDDVDRALAYGLAWQHDRDLLLILPGDKASPTLRRLPWIATPVRVWNYGPELDPRPAVVPSRAEVLSELRTWPVRPTLEHDLGDKRPLVSQLIAFADRHWALAPAHRQSYLAWHCEGRKVLTLQREGAGVSVAAGVQYSSPKPGQPNRHSVQRL